MIFNEVNHTYFNEKGRQYRSITALIKHFVKPFERDKIAKKYAKKHKKKVEDVIEEWKKSSDDAIRKGIAYHKIKEDEINGQPTIILDEVELPVFKAEWNQGLKINNSLSLEPGIYPELIVWSDKYGVAGQVDRAEVTKKEYLNIKDYKTSKEIKKHGFERWDGTKETMSFPLQNLEDCNFNHYCLQINLYAFLIRQQNRKLKLGKLEIEHIIGDFNEETSEFSNVQVITYNVPDMQDEARIILEYYKNEIDGH